MQKASAYADSARALAKELGNLEHLYEAYQNLIAIQEQFGNHQNALANFKQYALTKELIFNQANEKKSL